MSIDQFDITIVSFLRVVNFIHKAKIRNLWRDGYMIRLLIQAYAAPVQE